MPKKKKKASLPKKFRAWYASTPVRYRALVLACAELLLAIFLSLALSGNLGVVGDVIYRELFLKDLSLTGTDTPALFGWGIVVLIAALYGASGLVIFRVEKLKMWRFWIGILILWVSATALLAANSEVNGGLVGNYVATVTNELVGLFSYILFIGGILLGLFLLRLFSPLAIYEWIASDQAHDDEEMDEEGIQESGEDLSEGHVYEEAMPDETVTETDDEPAPAEKKRGRSSRKRLANRGNYKSPPLSLLNAQKGRSATANTRAQAQAIMRTLQNFNVDVTVEEVTVGPTFTRYSLRPAEGIRLQKIMSLQQNLELALAAHPIRIEAPIPGKSLVGIEIPNTSQAIVGLRDLMKSPLYDKNAHPLPLIVGKTITGDVFVRDLASMPHILVAGTTGSGKSVTIHNFILSLLFRYGPQDLRFIFIDPKRVELTQYKGIPHLYTDPITDPKKALQALSWTVSEMERRYQLLEEGRARDIISYNGKAKTAEGRLPYLVVIVDELADLMQTFPREIEGNIVRIAQKSRAVGIHLIISTQRPSVNIITGVVKANIPVRIAMQVASNIDSRTILDSVGAENLIGKGDLLFASAESKKPVRIQSAFVSESEVSNVVQHIIANNDISEDFIDIAAQKEMVSFAGGNGDNDDDDLYEEAKDIVITAKKASTSMLQRKLKIGYSRAARLIDVLEERGIVGPQVGSKPREILVESE